MVLNSNFGQLSRSVSRKYPQRENGAGGGTVGREGEAAEHSFESIHLNKSLLRDEIKDHLWRNKNDKNITSVSKQGQQP